MSTSTEKNGDLPKVEHVEFDATQNLVYEDDEEPELHAQTYFAVGAMFLLNLVQVFGLLGPPAGVRHLQTDRN